MNDTKPVYPLTVVFHEDGDTWILDNEFEVATNLEWFDSKDSEEHASITDNMGRSVILLVEELEVKKCIVE